jgi:hypothetical protein
MVDTDLQNPDIIQGTEVKTVSNTNVESANISASRDSPNTDVMRLRVSIGGTFSQVRFKIQNYLNRQRTCLPLFQ